MKTLDKLAEVGTERQRLERTYDKFQAEPTQRGGDKGRKRVSYGALAADELRCLRESAAQRVLASKETILKTSYRTRGKKVRQEELFEDLKKEVEERRKQSGAPTKWKDQSSPAYKEECERQAKANLGII